MAGLFLVALTPFFVRASETGGSSVFKEKINPHWAQDGESFWYRNDLDGGKKEFILVDAAEGVKRSAFDQVGLAEALSKAGIESTADRLPFDEIDFSEDKKELRFKIEGKEWQYSFDTKVCRPKELTAKGERKSPEVAQPRYDAEYIPSGEPKSISPDGKWIAKIRDFNVVVSPAGGGEERTLSSDGGNDNSYRRVSWSGDSKAVVSFRVETAVQTVVSLVESSPDGGGPAKLHQRTYPLPGDPFDSYELNLFDVSTGKQTKPEVDVVDFGVPRIHWLKDGKRFVYQKIDRGHQRFRLVEVDAHTGESRNLIDEKSDTFIWTAHTNDLGIAKVTWLEKTDEALFISEQSGWMHFYLVDVAKGGELREITKGEYVIRGLDWVDEEKRQIWFQAAGRDAEQDPYFVHYFRINFDGTDLVQLTEGNGNHSVQFSPTREYLIDSWSRVDAPPVHQLRRSSDGSLICDLEEADIRALEAGGWKAPEIFTAKARDGKTDIWGLILKPKDFDPTKKYPVIERIYAGPHGFHTPKSFYPVIRAQELADEGFIIVMMDAMGTAMRSKAFHDVCWKNLKDAGFPDRILWMKAAAADRPYMDLDRVGVFGTSAGGQNAGGAVLFHPEFYKVAVASCGCHDNRMDKASWNEQWMGYPVGPQYSESSNIDNASRLQGKLMLVVGEMDDNVPPESTYRFVDALIKAGKDFEFVMVPGENHGEGGRYGLRRRADFFIKHLLGQDPPNRNAAPGD